MPDSVGSSLDNNGMQVAINVLNQTNDLRKIDTSLTLTGVIQELIEKHHLEGTPEDYCLTLEAAGADNRRSLTREYRIVTEKNRSEMNAALGNPVHLKESPKKSVSLNISQLEGASEEGRKKAIDEIFSKCVYSKFTKESYAKEFAKELYARKGVQILTGLVSHDRVHEGEDLVKILKTIIQLVDQEIVSVEVLIQDTQFINWISRYINSETTEPSVMVECLEILKISVDGIDNADSIDYLDRQVPLPNLVVFFSRTEKEKLNSLKLINSLLGSVSPQRKSDMVNKLTERLSRSMIIDHLLPVTNQTRNDLDYELYMLQYHILDKQVKERMLTKMETNNTQATEKIKNLRSTALDTDAVSNNKNNSRLNAHDWAKLGFTNVQNPTLDFMVVPPGVLALDCMDYMARNHEQDYKRVVLEHSYGSEEHECPFVASSIELVKLLADILGIGGAASPMTGNHARYQEMFFKCEYPFEEFYFNCMLILNQTWREMRATREDFTKVFDVVREQIEKALLSKTKPKTFDEFKSKVKSYSDIAKKWQKDAQDKDPWSDSKPVQVLKEHLREEIDELVQQQRYNFMVEGTRFPRYKKDGQTMKGQYKYVKLHTNRKTIYVGHTSEKNMPSIEDLEPKIQVQDIKEVITGKDCDFLKEYRKKEDANEHGKTALCVRGESGNLDLVALDVKTYNYWRDGINILIGQPMTSEDYKKEKDILLCMEIKLRLLDLEGIQIPETAPPIPQLPPNLNFSIN